MRPDERLVIEGQDIRIKLLENSLATVLQLIDHSVYLGAHLENDTCIGCGADAGPCPADCVIEEARKLVEFL